MTRSIEWYMTVLWTNVQRSRGRVGNGCQCNLVRQKTSTELDEGNPAMSTAQMDGVADEA